MTWTTSPLEVEMYLIKRGGYYINKKGDKIGLGLSAHLEAMRRIIWPELDGEHNGQRWHGLIRDTISAHRVTCLLGPGSSSKTHSAAWIALCLWLSNPSETAVLVSSTDMRGLRLRVWGEITTLWQSAVQRFDFLPGHMLDSKLAITFDSSSDDDGDYNDRTIRNFRAAIIGIPTIQSGKQVGLSKWIGLKQKHVILVADECFVGSTLVDTPAGPRPISSLQPGQEVVTAIGPQRIVGTFSKNTNALHRVRTKDGREFVCTWNHPFLTQYGWVLACNLTSCHYMVSPDESLQVLQSAHDESNLLQQALRGEVCDTRSSTAEEILHAITGGQNNCRQKRDVPKEAGAAKAILRENEASKSIPAPRGLGEDDCQPPHETGCHAESIIGNYAAQGLDVAEALSNNRWANRGGAHAVESLPGSAMELSGEAFSDRCGVRSGEISSRSGWSVPFTGTNKGSGQTKSSHAHGAWVDSSALLQQEDFERYRSNSFGVEVFTLQVEGHHSYSVSGLVTKNCQFMGPSFLSAFANLNKNEKFTAIVLGNPNDTLDPLGKAAEPLDGWDGHMEPEKTSVWKTRFMDGACVNLIGTDSPNFDFPADKPARFKYLISRQKIEETAKFFAKDSFEYYSQCIGAMKIASLSRRVLTGRMCEDGHALDTDVNWEGGARTKVYFVDAGYGGDRCVGGWGEFGRAVNGQTILLLHAPTIIPVSAKAEKEPEQQIAEFVKRECEGLLIPPANMGHDASGRGSLGTFIARAWSAETQPIEAGGAPTDRPVSLDIFVWERKGGAGPLVKRLKLCKEHYVKRVTEFWYSVRYAVQATQIRGLTTDTMEEFCQRNWERVKDDKIELETKELMKLRIGRSPDLGDWACGIVEMARRRGFQISKLANDSTPSKSSAWLSDLQRRQKALLASKELVSV